jgi:hypothetical protein
MSKCLNFPYALLFVCFIQRPLHFFVKFPIFIPIFVLSVLSTFLFHVKTLLLLSILLISRSMDLWKNNESYKTYKW